jgi:SAM-dependent methyltransferase
MSDTPAADSVQALYERWVYPPKEYDLSALPLQDPGWHYDDLRTQWPLFWPSKPYRDDLDVLIAGCGSVAAAAQAYLYPKSRVVGVDVSRASLAHHEFLKNKHNLTNLALHHCAVEDVRSLQKDFDYIATFGVLHHVADPAAGLRALGEVLRRDGVIDVMVYGKQGRVGVTMLQELFRLLKAKPDDAGVQMVKDVLAALSPRHPVQTYRQMAAQDLSYDEGIVDTFLHPRDLPFSVADCLNFVESAGLVFQGWKENGSYYPDAHVSPNDPLMTHLSGLSERDLWQAVELLDSSIPGHWFHVCRPERDPATYTIQFDDDAFLDYIPVARVSQRTAAEPINLKPALIARPPFPTLGLDGRQAAVFWQIDGVRSLRQCLAAAGVAPEAPDHVVFARKFFGGLWRTGYVMFRLTEK